MTRLSGLGQNTTFGIVDRTVIRSTTHKPNITFVVLLYNIVTKLWLVERGWSKEVTLFFFVFLLYLCVLESRLGWCP